MKNVLKIIILSMIPLSTVWSVPNYILVNSTNHMIDTLNPGDVFFAGPQNSIGGGGLYLIQNKGTSKTETELIGPFYQRGVNGTLYIINATEYNITWYVNYSSIFCKNDSGNLPASRGRVLELGTCRSNEVYAKVAGPNGVKETNRYKPASLKNGVFVIRSIANRPDEFQIAGPYIIGS